MRLVTLAPALTQMVIDLDEANALVGIAENDMVAPPGLPVVGNFAYPLQLLYSSRIEEDDLARFILYDGCARIGEKLPIWGGRDTLTEHLLNRLPDRLVKLRKSPG